MAHILVPGTGPDGKPGMQSVLTDGRGRVTSGLPPHQYHPTVAGQLRRERNSSSQAGAGDGVAFAHGLITITKFAAYVVFWVWLYPLASALTATVATVAYFATASLGSLGNAAMLHISDSNWVKALSPLLLTILLPILIGGVVLVWGAYFGFSLEERLSKRVWFKSLRHVARTLTGAATSGTLVYLALPWFLKKWEIAATTEMVVTFSLVFGLFVGAFLHAKVLRSPRLRNWWRLSMTGFGFIS